MSLQSLVVFCCNFWTLQQQESLADARKPRDSLNETYFDGSRLPSWIRSNQKWRHTNRWPRCPLENQTRSRSHLVSPRYGHFKFPRLRLYVSRSSEVINLGANRKRIYNFLLVLNSNYARISYRLRDIAAQSRKMLVFAHPTMICRLLADIRLGIST